jgi:hypothetical protein
VKRILIFLTAVAASTAVCALVLQFLTHRADREAAATSQPDSQPDARVRTRTRTVRRSPFETLEPGLDFAEFTSPAASELGDSKVRVLRIDPAKFEFRLLCAGAGTAQAPLAPQAASQWGNRNGLVAAVNAGLVNQGSRAGQSLAAQGLLRTRNYVNNGHPVGTWRAFLGFDRLDRKSPAVTILDQDRNLTEIAHFKEVFATVDQGPRLYPLGRSPVFPHPTDKWSMCGIGVDRSEAGRILFIHVRSPYAMKPLAVIIHQLPLGLDTLMLTGKGVDAQLYVNAGDKQREFVGSYQAGVREDDTNTQASPLANVIGIVRKANPVH